MKRCKAPGGPASAHASIKHSVPVLAYVTEHGHPSAFLGGRSAAPLDARSIFQRLSETTRHFGLDILLNVLTRGEDTHPSTNARTSASTPSKPQASRAPPRGAHP